MPPLPIVTDVKTSTGFLVRLPSSGVRVPALVLSPLVEAGAAWRKADDSTLVQAFLGYLPRVGVEAG